jgi:hypothetical protein
VVGLWGRLRRLRRFLLIIYSSDIPFATRLTMRDTEMRMPRMHAFPPSTFGSEVIRSKPNMPVSLFSRFTLTSYAAFQHLLTAYILYTFYRTYLQESRSLTPHRGRDLTTQTASALSNQRRSSSDDAEYTCSLSNASTTTNFSRRLVQM